SSILESLLPLDLSLELVTFELSAQLFPSLEVQYKLDGALVKGKCEAANLDFESAIRSHQLHFVVTSSNSIGGQSAKDGDRFADTFSLPLPLLNSTGIYKSGRRPSFEVSISIGPIVHSFSTDLLNQVLLAQETLRTELMFLWKKLADEKWGTGKDSDHLQQHLPADQRETRLLFSIDVRCNESESTHYWLQIAATTPTGIAAILILQETHFQIGNKSTTNESIMAQAVAKLSLKLSQTYKWTLYEETKEEQREFATFITQISAKNEMPFNHSDNNFSSERRHWLHNYSVSLIRPFLMMRPKALDKAILFWLNYRNTYNCWQEERNKLLQMSGRKEEKRDEVTWRRNVGEGEAITRSNSSITASALEFQLSVSIRDGFHACMPLLGAHDDSSTVLAVSLHHTEVQVHVQQQIHCEANFDEFKISFIEGSGFEEDSMDGDPWARLEALSSDAAFCSSNFLFFPHGSYQLSTSAISAQNDANAKWLLSTVAKMEGMTLDLDNNIGKFVSSLIHTLSSITSLEEDVEEVSDEPEEEQDGLNQSSISSSDPNLLNPVSFTVQHRFSAPPVAEVEDDAQQFRHRVHSLEKKMHEHAMLVADLANCGGVSELTLETERRKLRQLEQLHLREFRRLVVTKLKGHVSNTKQHNSQRKSANEEPQQRKATPRARNLLTRSLEGSSLAGGSSGGGTPRAQLQNQQGSTVVKELLDMNIDVKVYIECGKCILRADPSKQLQQLDKTSFLPGHRRQFSAGTTSMTVDSTTQLSLPSVDARFIYTSDDAKMPLPKQMEENFGFVKSYRSLNQKCFYTSLELASMPLTTLITPALIDFLDQTLDPLTSTIFDKSSVQKASSEIGSFDGKKLDPAVELIAIDRLGLSFDLILHVSVQASSLRFEGRQQKSSAADCLLTLPSLTLNGCTRKCCDGMDRPTMCIFGWMELNSFSLSIYSPHQQASAHDALSLTLDRLRVTASRTRNSSLNSDDPTASNDVRLVFKFEAGKAAIVHDMRRLDELISFPKAWYRKKLIKRLFLGQKSLKAPNTVATRKELSMSTEQSVGGRNLNSEKSDLNHSSAGVGTNWKALVDVTFDWEEMNVNAQMSTTM
uniref:SHR-BD domain-containing protein n=1 Tax=Globodera pallida TaxID=36090 RepID=A0A183CPI7_GLOPA